MAQGSRRLVLALQCVVAIMVSVVAFLAPTDIAVATKFDEMREKILLPENTEEFRRDITYDETVRYKHILIPEGFFVLSKQYDEQLTHYTVTPLVQSRLHIDHNATMKFVGSEGSIHAIMGTKSWYGSAFTLQDYWEFAIYKVLDNGSLRLEIEQKYGLEDRWNSNIGAVTRQNIFQVDNYDPGLYLLKYRIGILYRANESGRAHYIREFFHLYIPFEIVDPELTFDRAAYFVEPGSNLIMNVAFNIDDPSSYVSGFVIKDPVKGDTTMVPATIERLDGTNYQLSYNVPDDAVKKTVNVVVGEAYYGGFIVAYRQAALIIDEEPDTSIPNNMLEFSTLCPFILNPPWAVAGQTATVGCYDNPLDSYTVTGGKAWIPNGSASPLTNQGNGTLTASLTAPSTEGVVPVLYEVDVQDASGRSFKVSGSQNMIVTSSPNTMYCPPPQDGVTSAPGGEVGVRLFR